MNTTGLEARQAYRTMLRQYPDVLNVKQLADILSVSTKTCYKLLQNGQIESIQIGRSYRIPKTKAFKYLLELSPKN
jgi:excisionase family DNA binding protein